MNDFPRMLYRAPGIEPIHGGHFGTRIVADEDAQHLALAEGWRLSTPDAVQAHAEASKPAAAPAAPGASEPADDAPPTRAEMEQKAWSLHIKFDGRTSDHKLAALIQAAV